MFKKCFCVVASVNLMCIGLSGAVMANSNGKFQKCYDNANTAAAMQQCSEKHLKSLEADISHTIKRLQFKLNKSEQQQLNRVQTAWLAFRDADCQFAKHGLKQASAQISVQKICLTELTKARLQNLNEYLMQDF